MRPSTLSPWMISNSPSADTYKWEPSRQNQTKINNSLVEQFNFHWQPADGVELSQVSWEMICPPRPGGWLRVENLFCHFIQPPSSATPDDGWTAAVHSGTFWNIVSGLTMAPWGRVLECRESPLADDSGIFGYWPQIDDVLEHSPTLLLFKPTECYGTRSLTSFGTKDFGSISFDFHKRKMERLTLQLLGKFQLFLDRSGTFLFLKKKTRIIFVLNYGTTW